MERLWEEQQAELQELRRTVEREGVLEQEGVQAVEYVIEELGQLDRQLKGGSLSQVIAKLQQINDSQFGAGMGSNNRVILTLYEILEVFKVMMKQLKVTQKELNKTRKILDTNSYNAQSMVDPRMSVIQKSCSASTRRKSLGTCRRDIPQSVLQADPIQSSQKSQKAINQLSDRQRLELYELRSAALKEIEQSKGESDPYLRRYLQSIDDLLRKADYPTTISDDNTTLSTL